MSINWRPPLCLPPPTQSPVDYNSNNMRPIWTRLFMSTASHLLATEGPQNSFTFDLHTATKVLVQTQQRLNCPYQYYQCDGNNELQPKPIDSFGWRGKNGPIALWIWSTYRTHEINFNVSADFPHAPKFSDCTDLTQWSGPYSLKYTQFNDNTRSAEAIYEIWSLSTTRFGKCTRKDGPQNILGVRFAWKWEPANRGACRFACE